MYHDDHSPPHFHAEYAGREAIVEMESLNITKGKFPRRATNLIRERATQHEEELRTNWQLMLAGEPLRKIDPLP